MYKVISYELPAEENKQVSANFTVGEFKCHDGSLVVFLNPDLVTLVQKIRNKVGRPIIINSGYRTPSHNKANDGAVHSQHMRGNAADIHVSGMTSTELHKIVLSIVGNTGGVGLYPSFVHVDCRAKPARWNG